MQLRLQRIEAAQYAPVLTVAPEWIKLVQYVYSVKDAELTIVFRDGKPIVAERIKEKIDFTK